MLKASLQPKEPDQTFNNEWILCSMHLGCKDISAPTEFSQSLEVGKAL